MSEFLNKAITAHSAWKTRLRSALDSGTVPDVSTVRSDNLCDLGKWIHGEGKELEARPEFQDLRAKHARFHVAAAAVVNLIAAKKKAEAAQSLESGEFAQASREVIAAITKLKAGLPA
jgi:hypothetical protein